MRLDGKRRDFVESIPRGGGDRCGATSVFDIGVLFPLGVLGKAPMTTLPCGGEIRMSAYD